MDTILVKKVRLCDVAREAKVSLPTASMALINHPDVKPETCKRVQVVSKKLGYVRPGERARRLEQKVAGQKSLRFGFLLLGCQLNDEAMTSMIQAMSQQASQLRARLELKSIGDEEMSRRTTVESEVMDFIRELDGVILEGQADTALLNSVESTHVPYLVVGSIMTQIGEVPPARGHFVDFNTEAMGQLATERLLACGHRRIGFLCERVIHGLYNYQWLLGYQNAHWDAQVAVDPALVHVAGKIWVGGKPAADYFNTLADPPTAYVCPDIRVGASFVSHMAERGIMIPPHNLILGGNLELAPRYHMESYPLLGYESQQLGQVVIEELYRLHQNPAMPPRRIQLPGFALRLPELPATGKS